MRKTSSLFLLVLFSAIANFGCAGTGARLEAAIASEHRSPENVARDRYRHPLETLTFFGIEEDMTVVEIYPGGGWYTEILAPYLKQKGKLIAAVYDRNPETQKEWMPAYNARFDKKIADNRELYGAIEVIDLALPNPAALAEPGSVDLILDFRNAHNWIQWDGDGAVETYFAALKHGGVLGIVDHRMDDEKPYDADNGYLHEGPLVELVEKHGFELVASSDLNRNPRDTKDHPEGVWTLPPSLQLGAEKSGKYLAIGESDRMTLKFVKP